MLCWGWGGINFEIWKVLFRDMGGAVLGGGVQTFRDIGGAGLGVEGGHICRDMGGADSRCGRCCVGGWEGGKWYAVVA